MKQQSSSISNIKPTIYTRLSTSVHHLQPQNITKNETTTTFIDSWNNSTELKPLEYEQNDEIMRIASHELDNMEDSISKWVADTTKPIAEAPIIFDEPTKHTQIEFGNSGLYKIIKQDAQSAKISEYVGDLMLIGQFQTVYEARQYVDDLIKAGYPIDNFVKPKNNTENIISIDTIFEELVGKLNYNGWTHQTDRCRMRQLLAQREQSCSNTKQSDEKDCLDWLLQEICQRNRNVGISVPDINIEKITLDAKDPDFLNFNLLATELEVDLRYIVNYWNNLWVQNTPYTLETFTRDIKIMFLTGELRKNNIYTISKGLPKPKNLLSNRSLVHWIYRLHRIKKNASRNRKIVEWLSKLSNPNKKAHLHALSMNDEVLEGYIDTIKRGTQLKSMSSFHPCRDFDLMWTKYATLPTSKL